MTGQGKTISKNNYCYDGRNLILLILCSGYMNNFVMAMI